MNNISSLAFVSPNAIIGKNNTIMPGAIITDNVVIGDGNYIGYNCIIGDFAEKVGFLPDLTKCKKVIIGDNNVFTKMVTIDAGTQRDTVIGNEILMLRSAHVGHDAVISDKVRIGPNVTIAGFVEVGESTNFGIGVAVHQRLKIPKNCMFGMNAVITKTTRLYEGYKYIGVPVRNIGKNQKS